MSRDGGAEARTAIVLASSDHAELAGVAVAAQLARRRARSIPVVAVWDPSRTVAAPADSIATAAARRTRDEVRGCGVTAEAVGRTVRVLLPADDIEAAAAIERLDARGCLVVVLAGAWGGPLLAPLERAGVVHADGPPLAVRACARTLARHGIEVRPVPRPTGPVARTLLRAGWGGRFAVRGPAESGQALLLALLGLTLAIVLAGVLGAVALAMSDREERQRAIDVAALAAADRMRGDWVARAGAPATIDLARYRERAEAAARRAAAANGVDEIAVSFPAPTAREAGPLAVRVRTAGSTRLAGVMVGAPVSATAELAPPAVPGSDAGAGDEYRGALARRDGKPMRPDVALAFDRMNAAATRAGRPLVVVSGYRSNAEQARLFAAHPDPKWVARPGTSLHRLGTELDLGPPAAYGWLAAHASGFGFKQRYSWEPWHFGLITAPASAHVAEQGRNPRAPVSSGTIPPWVPGAYRDSIRAASIRYRVSAALLSAQLKQESGFRPEAVSSAGAQGIAQFMPGTAASVGLRDPFDPEQAIAAQARLMAGLLRRFGSVPLALAAYNAGEGAVGRCQCVPPYPETRQYVARIIALMRGYDPDGALAEALDVRLVA